MALRARYCQGFETKVWSWFWSIFSLKTLRLNFGNFFEVEVWSILLRQMFGWDFDAQVWLRFWIWILINFWYDLTKILWWENSTPGSVVSLAMFIIYFTLSHPIPFWSISDYTKQVPPSPQIKKKWSRIEFQFSTNISLLSSQDGKTKLYILATIKKVSHLEINKPSKHQIERPNIS